jgi:NAD(P)-dependent dehydrogenase (short-subunit alcohol dehydrogenase family)
VSGALAKRPGKGSAALAAANAAVEVLGKGLAVDFGPRLRVNVISPGLTDTEVWANLPPQAKAGMLAGFGKEVPCGRAGVPSDIGHAIGFLLQNTWMTGTVLDVDGGAVVRE